jgi:hypothetical protein
VEGGDAPEGLKRSECLSSISPRLQKITSPK